MPCAERGLIARDERRRRPLAHLSSSDGVDILSRQVLPVGLLAEIFELLLRGRHPERILIESFEPARR
jgi:hypothetical protein